MAKFKLRLSEAQKEQVEFAGIIGDLYKEWQDQQRIEVWEASGYNKMTLSFATFLLNKTCQAMNVGEY